MKNQKVSMATAEQLQEIDKTIDELKPQLYELLTKDDAQMLIGSKGELNAGIRRAFEPFIRTKTFQYWISEWTRFYREVFGFECDYSRLRQPVSRDEFNWLVIADERVTTESAAQKCAERLPFWRWTNKSFDQIIIHNDRSETNGSYAIWLRDSVEADPVHQNKSAEQIWNAGVAGVTLREQLLLVLFYHWKHGKFLDIRKITLCTGSRYVDGLVPRVHWFPSDREVYVDWCLSGFRYGDLRCREVVS